MSNAAPLTEVLPFVLAGNAVFTLTSKKSDIRFTYKVRICKDNDALWFVSVLVGPDNTADYTYMGTLRRHPKHGYIYQPGKKSTISPDAPSSKAFAWFFPRVLADQWQKQADVHHAGRCGRCGRALTVPESVESGFGPECAGKVA